MKRKFKTSVTERRKRQVRYHEVKIAKRRLEIVAARGAVAKGGCIFPESHRWPKLCTNSDQQVCMCRSLIALDDLEIGMRQSREFIDPYVE